MKRAFAVSGIFLLGGFVVLALSDFHGDFYFMIQLLPDTELYKAELELTATIAGWDITSESKFYSDGWRYQNFYFEGMLGPFEAEGKIYFHAQDARYQKFWINLEMPLSGEGNYLRFSVDHWASEDDYFSSDEEMFGPWPCGVITWDEARDHYHETLHVQGPVVSVYTSHSGNVTIHVGKDFPDPDRFDIYIPASYVDDFKAVFGSDFPDNLVGKTVCIYGYIKTFHGIYEIETHDPDDLTIGPCCGILDAFGPLMIYRAKLALVPVSLTVDFADCCSGIQFKKLEFSLADMLGCCGFLWDAGLSFTKCHGFEEFYVRLKQLPFPCCDITLQAEITFTVDGKSVAVKPIWEGFVTGCIEVYGDFVMSNNILGSFDLYGFSIECSFDSMTLRAITAFDPDKVEELTDITFYTNEFEYLGIEYTGAGCCGGELSFTSGFWFGTAGTLFDLQRARFELEFPIYDGFTAIIKGQWDLSVPELDWFDIGWKIEF